MNELSDFFGPGSPLAELLPGFRPRRGQAWMAEAVGDAIENGTRLVIEAGTGTGKTFAYLVPALLSGRKTIISTGTKALQDQLFHRDLPLVSKALGRPVRTALLKGRANYLCLNRLDALDDAPDGLADDLAAVREWRHRTDGGDRAELVDVAEDSRIWPYVTSTADNCLGQKCPQFSDCHVARARRDAQEAELVVVNHHLLLADLAMKETGFVEFLPDADAIIIDEAHQLPDLATQFFGVALGSRELDRLVEETRAATLSFSQPELERRIDRLATALSKLVAEAPRDEGRHELAPLLPELRPALDELAHALAELAGSLAEFSDADTSLENLEERLAFAIERLAVLTSEDAWDGLRWLEINPRSLRMHLTPLDVAAKLSGLLARPEQGWVFTSATLAVGEDFSHFTSRMGLAEARTLCFPSPYALEARGLVYLPQGLPQPSDKSYTASVLDAIVPLFDSTGGGVFILFTSHRALQLARRWFRSRRDRLGGRTLLAQGTAPRDELLRRFRRDGNAVLLGTGTFWEGVDVRGTALTVVAIDKLPFASPADPLTMARLEYIRRSGGNGFVSHQLPQAVLALKQGAGRLLRGERDYGVIVLCDPRVSGKSYGRQFLDALQPMPVTRSPDDVQRFFERLENEDAVA